MKKSWLFWINGVIILALCLAASPQPVQAVGGVIEVTTTADEYGTNAGECSLREAVHAVNISAAFNGCAEGDTIQLTGGETYTLAINGANNDNNLSGDLDVLASLTLTSSTNERAIITGNTGWADRLLDVQTAGITVTLNSLFMTGGDVDGQGGAIRNAASSTLILTSVVVKENKASTGGGGLANTGSGAVLQITQGVFQNNSVQGAGPAGGGILGINSGQITVIQSAIVDNQALGGDGGGFSIDGTLVLKNVTISGNSAADNGGGIYLDSGGTGTWNNVTITNNTADANGDEQGNGGGVLSATSTRPTMSNSLLAGNFDNSSSGSIYTDCASAIPAFITLNSQGYNLFGDWTSSGTNCSFQTEVVTDQKGTSTPLNPGLAPLSDNGTDRPSHALLGNSLALNAGNPAIPTGSSFTCETTDQRGLSRATGRCDVGAFELKLFLYLPLIQR
ncbi:MAG: CSLREA domain-containing protein [Anaerolineales bacterium]|nr:CSLREA domain-containing protein [Anaerolineales bacterium]